MAIALMVIGAILVALMVIGLFADADSSASEADKLAQEAVNSLNVRLIEAFKSGETPTWQSLKALAEQVGVVNERLPDVFQELTRSIGSGEVQAPSSVFEAIQSYQTAHESELLLAAMPTHLTLPSARLLESLGAQRGLAQPLMQEIKSMELALTQRDTEIQRLAFQVEAVRPGFIKNTFSLAFAVSLIVVGFGMYYKWVNIELRF